LLAQAAAYKVNRFLDWLFRKLPAEEYMQLVGLPLCGAIVGGLIGTAIPVFLDHPPWKHNSSANVAYALIAMGAALLG
jgi:hypothetical protein